MAMDGSWVANEGRALRYQYNGKELNSDFGLDTYDYGLRYYDAAIGKFSGIDPAASKYVSISPYAYVANNPITFVDPRGDTLRAVNGLSGERALGLIQGSFNSASIASSLFSLADDGVTFNTISSSDIFKALGSLSADEAALFLGYAMAINGTETNVVEVLKRGEAISEYGQEILGYSNANQLDDLDGGGRTEQARYDGNIVKLGADGSYAAFVMDSKAQVYYNDNRRRSSLPGELMAHELIGHGLGDRYGNGVDASIQMSNTYLRTRGKNYYRPDHSPGIHSDNFNPHIRPKFTK